MGDWDDVFGANYTPDQFVEDYLTEKEPIKYERRVKRDLYIRKGVKDRKKKIKRLYARLNRGGGFLTYEEAISWAKKNPGRNIRRNAWGYGETSIDPKYRDFYKKS